MPYYPNPTGGAPIQAANDAAAKSAGWAPSMGTYGGNANSATAPTGTGSSAFDSGGAAPGAPGAPPAPGVPQGFNQGAADLAMRLADTAAQREYNNAKLAADSEQNAFTRAQAVWQRTFDEESRKYNQSVTTAGLTGSFNGAPTLAAQKQQGDQTQAYLSLISGLKGPADYGSYLRTLGSTPGGLRDLVAASAGRYAPGSGTTGVGPQAASLGSLLGAATTGVSGGAGGTDYNSYMNAASGLVAPNQIAPAAYNAFTDTQKQMLLGMYGQQGWNTQDVMDLYQKSLPKYGAAAAAGGAAGRLSQV